MSAAGARTSTRANGYNEERPRMSSSNSGSFSGDRQEGRHGVPPRTGNFHGGLPHKRTASGNPRPVRRATDERRFETRRVTEKMYETQVERSVPQPASPEKSHGRTMPVDKKKETGRQRSTEWRQKESQETSQGMFLCAGLRKVGVVVLN